MKLTTHLDDLSPRRYRDIVLETIKWCRTNMGVYKKRKNKFSVAVRSQRNVTREMYGACYGEFNYLTNTLYIHPEQHETVKELIRTTIHEYTHYLQPVRTYYTALSKKYGYQNNPFEKEARKNEDLYYKECWKNIKKNL
jgi:hypothetical protein